jgi:hypothetical protein
VSHKIFGVRACLHLQDRRLTAHCTGANRCAICLEFHGPEIGQKLYDDALKNRAAAVKVAGLACELDQARGLLAAELKAGKLRLSELQEAMDRTYQEWLDACAALESQRMRNQQLKASRRDLIQAILAEMKGPAPVDRGVNLQWHVPSWVKPEAESKGSNCGT